MSNKVIPGLHILLMVECFSRSQGMAVTSAIGNNRGYNITSILARLVPSRPFADLTLCSLSKPQNILKLSLSQVANMHCICMKFPH